ncbi:hypothetical protein ACIQBJ_29260 [Kitasatospora sp. NPDC088391]|uniref:hypothetical protein n=1 Tax=Kitasatospora sp. NPDC088391 TaxID=3364074 RepID=UPI00380C3CED
MPTITDPHRLPEGVELDVYTCRFCGYFMEADARLWLCIRRQPDGTPLVYVDGFATGTAAVRCGRCGYAADDEIGRAVAALVARGTTQVAGIVL